ncbi:hypothetical protein IWW57_002130 [Coemansia sp. S610]|nr:hypothetical protein IWW57_002130 [Coemansia sp. S610]KAJ2701731.1 hypothetical protein H4218_001222 [Coemansia sp. IMI 209128]
MSQRGEQQSSSDRGSRAGAGAVTAPATSKISTDVIQPTWAEPQAGSSLDMHGWRMSLYENRTLASAITAAVTGMLVGYPFDSLKTRMQTYHYPSLLACARKSIAEEGVRGLYRGLLPPLLTASAAKSLSFSVFEETKHWLRRHDPYALQQGPLGLPNFQRKTVGSVALSAGVSGSISGAVIAILCCPLELIKVQMQLSRLLNRDLASSDATTASPKPVGALVSTPAGTLQGGGAAIATRQLRNAPAAPPWATSNLSVLREIVRRRGPLGMYYGIGLHILRDSSGTAIYFASYETAKETLRRLTGSDTTGPLTHMLAGGTCGVVSWLLIFPVDLIKSTMQSQVLKPKGAKTFTSSLQCLRDIHSRLGLAGLYRGISVSLIRAFPIHGLNFVVYEWARAHICRLAGRPE